MGAQVRVSKKLPEPAPPCLTCGRRGEHAEWCAAVNAAIKAHANGGPKPWWWNA